MFRCGGEKWRVGAREGDGNSIMDERKKGADWMRQIDENLRRVYDETASEAVPDRFQKLLDKLKERDAGE